MGSRRGALLGVAAALVALAVFAVAVVRPWATRDALRPDSIPSPTALLEVGVDEVKPGREACTRPFVIGARSAQALFRITTYAKAGPAVAVRIHGKGYRSRARIAGGYADNAPQRVTIRPPRRPTVAEACFKNLGPRRMGLFAAADGRSNSRSTTRVDGNAVDDDVSLAFFEPRPVSLLDRLPSTVHRLTTFRPAVVGDGLVWALIGLVLLAVPAAALWAVGSAARADDRP